MNKIIGFLTVLLLGMPAIFAQQGKVEYRSSRDLIDKGIKYHDQGKYSKAVDLYRKVSENDTAYHTACYELAFSLGSLEKYEEAVEIGKWLMSEKTSDYLQVIVLTANYLDDLEKSDEAMALYQTVADLYPYSQQLHYNYGVACLRAKKYAEAEREFLISLRIDPFHLRTHMMLGLTNAYMGRFVNALLCYNMAALISPETESGSMALNSMVNLINGEFDAEMKKSDYPLPDSCVSVDLDETESLLRSNFAMNKKFKVPCKINHVVIRSNYLLFTRLLPTYPTNNPYFQFYIPFYRDLLAQGYFEVYSNYISQTLGYSAVDKYFQSNEAKIKKFIDWAGGYLAERRMRALAPAPVEGAHPVFSYNDGKLYAMTTYIDKAEKIAEGPYLQFYAIGNLEQEGQMINNKKEGVWTIYYSNGQVNMKIPYKNDKMDGLAEVYDEDGFLTSTVNLKEDERDGESIEYFHDGSISNRSYYVNGKIDSVETDYYPDGTIEYITTYTNEGEDYTMVGYHANGQKSMEASYTGGKKSGRVTYYHENGQLRYEADMQKDMLVGFFKRYYANGNVEIEGELGPKGQEVGVWKEYYSSGIISTETDYRSGGKAQRVAKEYDPDGTLQYIMTFKDDLIAKMEFFDASGNSIAVHDNLLKGESSYVALFSNGKRMSEGQVKDGNSTGLFRYWTAYGNLDSENEYRDGYRDGVARDYYANGRLSYIANYDEGQMQGYYESYYLDSSLYAKGNYDNDNEAGDWYYYYPNGQLKEYVYYLDGQINGINKEYTADGKLASIYHYDMGMLLGVEHLDTAGNTLIKYDIPGGFAKIEAKIGDQVVLQTRYVSDGFQDTMRLYSINGTLLFEGAFKNGLRDGHQTWYNDDGLKVRESDYLIGDLNGEVRQYNFNGQLEQLDHYVMGEATGQDIGYHPNGKVSYKADYAYDQRHGFVDYYSPEGDLALRLHFNRGILIGYSYLGSDNKLLTEIPVDSGNVNIVSHFANGKVSVETNYIYGNRQGTRKFYYSSGKLCEVINMYYDRYHGPVEYYFPNGQLMYREEYYLGDKNGLCVYYYENGKKMMELPYQYDNLHGTANYYNKEGKLIKSRLYFYDRLISETVL